MELIRADAMPVFANSGVHSQQLLFPENAPSSRVTITRVTVAPGTANPPHRHAESEQVWVALEGAGTLLLADDETASFASGDVVRFAPGDLHGFRNTGDVPFVYVSVTSPPINFRAAYNREWNAATERAPR